METLTALQWGKTTIERNKNLDLYHSLRTEKEKSNFINDLSKN